MKNSITQTIYSKSFILYIHNILNTANSILLFCLFRAACATYGGSQARDPIKAVAAGLHQGHSNIGPKLSLQPVSQLMAIQDP